MSSVEPIWGFAEHRFLSNFWMAEVSFEGVLYPSNEHAYQAAKTLDPFGRVRIQTLETPGRAKREGQKLDLREDWDIVRLEVMEALVTDKFTRHQKLRFLLLATGERPIFEANHWGDHFWGVDVKTGEGENHLGLILVRVRSALRSQPPSK